MPGYFENMKLIINLNNNYIFLHTDEKEQIQIFNKKLKIYNLTKDKDNKDFDKEIRYK